MGTARRFLNEFYLDGGDKQNSHVFLHITEPVSEEEKQKGVFFAVLEMRQVAPDALARIQEAIEKLEVAYYEHKSLDNEKSFEDILRGGNALFEQIKTKGAVDCCVGVLHEDELLCTYHGTPVAWIIYTHKNEFKIQNIFASGNIAPSPADHFFSDILRGELKEGQRVLISAPSLGAVMDRERFLKMSKDKTVEFTVQYLRKFLSQLSNGRSFGGVFFEYRKVPLTEQDLSPAMFKGEDSVTDLVTQEKITEELLAPSASFIWKEWKKMMGVAVDGARTVAQKVSERRAAGVPGTQGQPSAVTRVTVDSTKKMVAGGKRALSFVTDESKRRQVSDHITDAVHDGIVWCVRRVRNLPPFTRLLFAGVVVFAVLLVGSIGVLRWRDARALRQAAWVSSLESVADKKNQIASALVYDEEKALELLRVARQELNGLMPSDRTQTKDKQELEDSLTVLGKELQKITDVTPVVLNAAVPVTDARIVRGVGDELAVIAPGDGRVTFVKPADGSVRTVSIPLEENHLQSAFVDDDGLLFVLDDQGKLYHIEKDFNVTAWTPVQSDIMKTMIDATVYNNRLYTLDPFKNQIFRLSPDDKAFTGPQPWVKDSEVHLGDALTFAFDGNVFVLKQEGQIYKIRKGMRDTSFALQPIEPPLEKATALQVAYEDNDLFVLENGAVKRVVRLDKNGKMKRQYTAAGWTDLKAFSLDTAAKRVYVLNGEKIEWFGY